MLSAATQIALLHPQPEAARNLDSDKNNLLIRGILDTLSITIQKGMNGFNFFFSSPAAFFPLLFYLLTIVCQGTSMKIVVLYLNMVVLSFMCMA